MSLSVFQPVFSMCISVSVCLSFSVSYLSVRLYVCLSFSPCIRQFHQFSFRFPIPVGVLHRPSLRSFAADGSRDYSQSATVSDNRQKTIERRRWRNSMEHRRCQKCRRAPLSWLLNVALLLWAGNSRVPKLPRVTDGLKRLVKGKK